MNLKVAVITGLVCLTLILSIITIGCSPQPRAILGRISYTGTHNGNISVTATRPGEQGITSYYSISMNNIGSYDIRVRTGTYTVSAYIDTNYDNKLSSNEPYGYYDGNGDGKADEIVVKGEVTDIDITLYDP